MKRTYRTVVSVAVALFALSPLAAHAGGTLYVTNAMACEGKSFTIDITLDVDQPANVSEVHMTFGPSNLQVSHIDQFTNSIFPVPAPGTGYDNVAGTLDVFQGQIHPGWQGTGGHLTRVTLFAPAAGPVALAFLPTSLVLANDGNATEIPVTFIDPVILVRPSTDPACTPPTPVPTPAPTPTPDVAGVGATPGPTPTPLVCPEIESCELGIDEVVPCNVIESCPGQPDTVYENFVAANATSVECPIRTLCMSTFEEDSYEGQIEQVLGNIVSEPAARVLTETIYNNDRWLEFIAAVTAAGTLFATLLALLQMIGLVGSLSQVGEYLLRGIIAPILPDASRTRLWGKVFDSYTKRPVGGVRVELLSKESRVLETRFTDRDGRYGFVLSGATIQESVREVQIHATKKGYRFPASPPTDGDEGLLYQNVYRGGIIAMKEDELVSHDIPLEPEVKEAFKGRKVLIGARLSRWIASFADASFKVGIVTAPLNFALQPSWTSGIIAGVYVVMLIARLLGARFRPYGLVLDRGIGSSVPYSLITLNDPNGKRIGQAVSDDRGRYFLLTEKGSYHLDVQTPAQLQPARKVRRVLRAKRGWVSRTVRL